MIGNDVAVRADGSVIGTFKYIDNFTDFSSDTSLQSGYYFPVNLTQTGTTMTIKKDGVASVEKTNIPFDSEILLRIPNENTTFTIEVDGVDVVTFNFTNATFAA